MMYPLFLSKKTWLTVTPGATGLLDEPTFWQIAAISNKTEGQVAFIFMNFILRIEDTLQRSCSDT